MTLVAWMLVLVGCGGSRGLTHIGAIDVYRFEHESTDVYVLSKGESLVMIDSGYERNAPTLDLDMRSQRLDPTHLKAVVLTHGHADHAGGARYFRERYGARVVAGKGDAAMLAKGANEPLCPTGLLGRYRYDTDQSATYTPLGADVLVDAPFPLRELTGIDALVLPLPGHTSGSLVVKIDGAVFAGDLFRGSLVGGGAATHLYMCDVAQNRRDIQHLVKDLAPDAATFFVGHFGAVSRDAVLATFVDP